MPGGTLGPWRGCGERPGPQATWAPGAAQPVLGLCRRGGIHLGLLQQLLRAGAARADPPVLARLREGAPVVVVGGGTPSPRASPLPKRLLRAPLPPARRWRIICCWAFAATTWLNIRVASTAFPLALPPESGLPLYQALAVRQLAPQRPVSTAHLSFNARSKQHTGRHSSGSTHPCVGRTAEPAGTACWCGGVRRASPSDVPPARA